MRRQRRPRSGWLGPILGYLLAGQLALVGQVASAQTTITFWPSSNPEEIAFATDIVTRWNAEHPELQVRMQPLPASRSTEEVLLAAIAARTTPDVAANIYPGAISQYVEAGGLYQHDTLPGFMEFMVARSGEAMVELYTHPSGHVYQVPWKSNPVMFAYNVDLLAEAGIDPTQLATHSGFLAAAQTVHEHWNGEKYLYAPTVDVTWWQRFFDFYTLYIAASEGQTLLDDQGRVIFDNDAGKEVFEFLSAIFREGYAPKGQSAQNRFFQGQVLVEQAGPFTMPFYQNNAPEGFRFALIPPPVPDRLAGRPVYTYGDPKNIAIFTNSRFAEESWQFIQFILSPENDALFMELTGQIPYRLGVESDPLFAEVLAGKPNLPPFLEQSARTRGVDDTPYLIEIFSAISREYEAAVVQGARTPEEGLRRAAQRARDIVSGFY
ncbi:extracellular solute-binding protein [Guyparkeria sp.]|uniref:ABC transporter substrate-binding protein n=1 Tax=Guyparkeria sp. TaxID=2035736 RepID=UPI0039705F2F